MADRSHPRNHSKLKLNSARKGAILVCLLCSSEAFARVHVKTVNMVHNRKPPASPAPTWSPEEAMLLGYPTAQPDMHILEHSDWARATMISQGFLPSTAPTAPGTPAPTARPTRGLEAFGYIIPTPMSLAPTTAPSWYLFDTLSCSPASCSVCPAAKHECCNIAFTGENEYLCLHCVNVHGCKMEALAKPKVPVVGDNL
jgi:hypothetical protein